MGIKYLGIGELSLFREHLNLPLNFLLFYKKILKLKVYNF